MHTPALPLSLLALLMGNGCGASMSTLVQEGRWFEACEETLEGYYTGWEAKRRYVLGEAARATDAEVSVHVFTPEELAGFLPHVPARMASGEVVLVAAELSYARGDAQALTIEAHPGPPDGPARPFECCGPGQWMDLDGRAAEWEQMEEARVAAERRAEERRERYGGPFGFWRAMAELGAGLSADLAFMATAGMLEIDVSSLPGAVGSPFQLARAVAARVQSRIAEDGSGEDPAAQELAVARARSLATLANLVTPSTACTASTGERCSAVHLYELSTAQPVATVTTKVSGMYARSGEECFAGSEVTEDVAVADQPRPLSAVFPPVASP